MRTGRCGIYYWPPVQGSVLHGVIEDNAISNFAVIPAGAFSATVTLTPGDDALAEGAETIWISLTNTSYYNAVPATTVAVTFSDNEPVPPSLSLQFVSPSNGLFDLTLSGAASRLFTIEASSNLSTWQPFEIGRASCRERVSYSV